MDEAGNPMYEPISKLAHPQASTPATSTPARTMYCGGLCRKSGSQQTKPSNAQDSRSTRAYVFCPSIVFLGHHIAADGDDDGLRIYVQLPEELTLGQMAEHEGCFVNMMVALLAFPATEAPSTDSPLEAVRKEMVNKVPPAVQRQVRPMPPKRSFNIFGSSRLLPSRICEAGASGL